MSPRHRTEPHTTSVARSHAYIEFQRRRRDMLHALRLWMLETPQDEHVGDEVDATVSAMRQIVVAHK